MVPVSMVHCGYGRAKDAARDLQEASRLLAMGREPRLRSRKALACAHAWQTSTCTLAIFAAAVASATLAFLVLVAFLSDLSKTQTYLFEITLKSFIAGVRNFFNAPSAETSVTRALATTVHAFEGIRVAEAYLEALLVAFAARLILKHVLGVAASAHRLLRLGFEVIPEVADLDPRAAILLVGARTVCRQRIAPTSPR
ncbi:MAG: hypothetical protein IPK13_27425 [Deltaproteobacteria bacterium]|nr:hypothetical protein [Deltaproteobacteria bacterium]